MRPAKTLPLSEKERSSSSQLLNQPADQVMRSPAAVPENRTPDDVRVDERHRRGHGGPFHESEIPAVLDHLQPDAFLLLADRHPGSVAERHREVQIGARPSAGVGRIETLVVAADPISPGSRELDPALELEIVDAEELFVVQVADLLPALGILGIEGAVLHAGEVEPGRDPRRVELVPRPLGALLRRHRRRQADAERSKRGSRSFRSFAAGASALAAAHFVRR